MKNLKDYNSFMNEGIFTNLKDKLKRRWLKFKDEMHPWDFTLDEWEEKWGDKKNDKRNKEELDPYGEEMWDEEKELPVNPYSIQEFNKMIRNKEIRSTNIENADFIWKYKNGKVVYFKIK